MTMSGVLRVVCLAAVMLLVFDLPAAEPAAAVGRYRKRSPHRTSKSKRRHNRRRSQLRTSRRRKNKRRSVQTRNRHTREVEGRGFPYKVLPGDTLQHVGKRFRVSVKQLQQWNHLKGWRIRIGQILRIKSPLASRRMRLRSYQVQQGDRLNEIARRFRVSVRHLRLMNRRLRRRRGFRAGMTLRFYAVGPEKDSLSIGLPHRGRLKHGEKLPRLKGVYMKNGPQWGTNETINYVVGAVYRFRRWARRLRGRTPLVVLGDISRKDGGRFRGHRSHQSGRDLDVGYIAKRNPNLRRFKGMTCRNMDVKRSWLLINAFLQSKAVERIFVNHHLQRCFYDMLRKQRVSKHKLAYIFQYPRGRGATRGILRHFRNHHHHFHVRFQCPPRDRMCRDNHERVKPRLLRVSLRYPSKLERNR